MFSRSRWCVFAFALACFRVRVGVRWRVFALVCFRVRVGVFSRSRQCVFAFALMCFRVRVRVGVFSRSRSLCKYRIANAISSIK